MKLKFDIEKGVGVPTSIVGPFLIVSFLYFKVQNISYPLDILILLLVVLITDLSFMGYYKLKRRNNETK